MNFEVPEYKEKPNTNIYAYSCFNGRNHGIGADLDLVFYRHLTPINRIFNDLDLATNSSCSDNFLLENVTHLLQCMMKVDYILNPYALFILATNGFHPNKAVRLAVSETLIHCLNQSKVDLVVLAKHYSILIYANYAPFSRLLDCLMPIKGSSDVNDRALIQLLGLIFNTENKPENFPTQFKKLFELYYELICQYQVKPDQDMRVTLQVWQEKFPSLKSIIHKILKEVA